MAINILNMTFLQFISLIHYHKGVEIAEKPELTNGLHHNISAA